MNCMESDAKIEHGAARRFIASQRVGTIRWRLARAGAVRRRRWWPPLLLPMVDALQHAHGPHEHRITPRGEGRTASALRSRSRMLSLSQKPNPATEGAIQWQTKK